MILITGANGYIGINLVEKLAKLREDIACFVYNHDRKNVGRLNQLDVKIIYGDLLDKNSLKKAIKNAIVVVHLAAAIGSDDPKLNYDVNFLGTKNLVDECLKNGVKRFVYSSSIAAKYKITTEYGKSKKMAEEYIKSSGINFTILRPTLVYGRNGGLVFNQMVDNLKKLPVIPIIGNGKNKKQPVYIDDFVDIIISTIKNDKIISKEYDVGGSDVVTLNSFVDMINETISNNKLKIHVPVFLCRFIAGLFEIILRNKSPISSESVLGFIQDSEVDISLVKKDFNYVPMPLKEGLKKSLKN